MEFLENLDTGFDPYDYNVTADIFGYENPGVNLGSSNAFTFDNFLNRLGDFSNVGGGLFGGLLGGSPANNPIATSQQAGNQLAYNLGESAGTAAIAAQGLGIKGQLLGAGTALLGEDAQLNRETNAMLRGQQLNQTNLARERNSQLFKTQMAGRMSPMAIARASAMAYGV
jgi:hypothetical protein